MEIIVQAFQAGGEAGGGVGCWSPKVGVPITAVDAKGS